MNASKNTFATAAVVAALCAALVVARSVQREDIGFGSVHTISGAAGHDEETRNCCLFMRGCDQCGALCVLCLHASCLQRPLTGSYGVCACRL
jgi:hypothetical protein